MTSDAPAKRLSLKEQAEYVASLAGRCWAHGDERYSSVLLSLTADDVELLRELAARLKRMAPHEDAIRRTVVGR